MVNGKMVNDNLKIINVVPLSAIWPNLRMILVQRISYIIYSVCWFAYRPILHNLAFMCSIKCEKSLLSML